MVASPVSRRRPDVAGAVLALFGRLPADAWGPAAVVGATAVAAWPLVVGGTMVGQDTAAFFYPVFRALGRRLANGDLPGWNPHQFAGVPFAADPESGWMSLPAMFLFALLPIAAAAKSWLLFHLLLAGFGSYALARVLGLGVLGAVTAAVAYQLSGLVYARTVCCPAYGQVAAWLPAILVAAELAMRSRRRATRIGWWGVCGLGLGQVFVAWLGQGAYYALLAFGGYVAYRGVIDPPDRSQGPVARVGAAALQAAVPVLIGLGLSAAAIVPRIAYTARTNLAEGYTGDLAWAANLGGWDPEIAVQHLLGRSFYYAGGATLALAVVGVLLGRGRHGAPFFACLTVGALVLAQREPTWLHRPLFALLPRFEELHRHWPERDMVVFFLGPAMLAGIAVHRIGSWSGGRWPVALVAFAPLVAVVWLGTDLAPVAVSAARGVAAVGFLLLLLARLPTSGRRPLMALLPVIVFVDLFAIARYNVDHGLYGGFHKLDLDASYAPSPAATFLAERMEEDGGPSRFFGYDPGIHVGDDTPRLYRYFFADPRAVALLVNNRATGLGLEDIQGYNPIQPRRYVEFIEALNGAGQEYHEANVYPAGLDSPLLDLLNARYAVVPATIPPDRPDLRRLVERWPRVYADGAVQVLENEEALPRAWIVHETRRVAPTETLPLLAAGAVDPRRVALLSGPMPEVRPAVDPTADRTTWIASEADRLRVSVRTDAPGLLVLSETADPDWRAEVDGGAVPILTVDHLLRGVPIPAGEHIVELRYESRTLTIGTALSLAAYACVVTSWIVAARRPRRRTSR